MGVGGDKPCARAFLYHEKKTELADPRLSADVGGGAGAAVEQLFPEGVCAGGDGACGHVREDSGACGQCAADGLGVCEREDGGRHGVCGEDADTMA